VQRGQASSQTGNHEAQTCKEVSQAANQAITKTTEKWAQPFRGSAADLSLQIKAAGYEKPQ